MKSKGIDYLLIIPSYPLDQEFALYKNNRTALFNELTTAVDVHTRPARFKSNVTPELSYQFAWDAGVYMGASTYNPIEHAQNHHRQLFSHAKKVFKNRTERDRFRSLSMGK